MKVDVQIVQGGQRGAQRLVEGIEQRVRQRLADEAWRRSAEEASAQMAGGSDPAGLAAQADTQPSRSN